MRNPWAVGTILLVVCAPLLARADDPAKICVPPARGVPGRSEPPRWWGAAEGRDQSPNDPRWQGALRITHGTDNVLDAEGAAFRALFHASPPDAPGRKHLYLSWNVEGDPFALPADPAVHVKRMIVGIGPDCNVGTAGCDASKFHVIKLEAMGNGSAVQQGTAVIKGVYRYTPQAGAGRFALVQTNVTTLAWKDTATAWMNSAQVPKNWTMQVRIPVHDSDVTQGLPIPDNFRLFYRGDYLLNSTVDVTWTWPRAANPGAFGFPNLVTIDAIPPTEWGLFRLGQDGSAGCQLGVTLSASDIGTVAGACPADPAALKAVPLTGSIARTADNCFVARPRNQSGAPIPANKLTATFRIANWGSTVDFGAWDDLLAERNPRPAVQNQGSLGTSPTDNVGVLSFTWKPETEVEKCRYVPGYTPAGGASCPANATARWGHQCMQVELKSVAADLVVLNDSVHRNMDFIDATLPKEVMQIARIHPRSFQRLPIDLQREIRLREGMFLPRPVTGAGSQLRLMSDPGPGAASAPGNYSLYLRVERNNMGDAIQPAQWKRQFNEISKEYQRLDGSMRVTSRIAPSARPRPVWTDRSTKLPSFVVHVYRDTGHVINDGGITRKVFRVEPSFGAFVKAPRDLEGWQFAIDGLEESPETGLLRLSVADTGDALLRVRLLARTPATRAVKFVPAEPKWRDVRDTRLNPGSNLFKPGLVVEPYLNTDPVDRNRTPQTTLPRNIGDLPLHIPAKPVGTPKPKQPVPPRQ